MFDFITADTHFSHKNLLNYEPERMQKALLYGYDDFDKYMIDTWNKRVSKDNTILHLGDFGFKEGYKTAKELNGKITLLRGNHDNDSDLLFYKKLGWKIIDKIVLDISKAHLIFNKLSKEFKKDELNNKLLCCLVVDIQDKRVMFSHFPVFDGNLYDRKYSKIVRILEFVYKESGCDYNIHGHTHSRKAKEVFCKSACLELNDFELINTKTLF